MGMFDYIEWECLCPCGETVKNFQSKDGNCQLETLKPWEVRNFYSLCERCKAWIEFTSGARVGNEPPPEPEGWRESLKMTVSGVEHSND